MESSNLRDKANNQGFRVWDENIGVDDADELLTAEESQVRFRHIIDL